MDLGPVEGAARRVLEIQARLLARAVTGELARAATALTVARLPGPVAADPTARRIAVLERLYWPERNEPFIKAIIAALRGTAGPSD